MRKVVQVSSTLASPYPVFCGSSPAAFLDAVWLPSFRQAVIIGDTNTEPRFGSDWANSLLPRTSRVLRLSFPAGEAHKTRETKAILEDAMLDAHIDRSACVVAVGGGITLDLAGYLASTYLRGIPAIYVATTLLAQVDASVGGKTGVNTSHGKNLIGTFSPPRAVLLSTSALQQLPAAEWLNGWAEAVKTAVIADDKLFASIERWSQDPSAGLPQDIIEQCVRIKADIVEKDETESAFRQVLNFGHTVAHAIEKATHHEVSHGKAVAFGMLVESRIAQKLVGFPPQHTTRLEELLGALNLPTMPLCEFDAAAPFFKADKKSVEGTIRCALPERIGAMAPAEGRWAFDIPEQLLRQAWTGSN